MQSNSITAFKAARNTYKDSQRDAFLGDADLLAASELLFIQARSRHLHRNNGIINAAETKFASKLKAVTVLFYNKATGKASTALQELWDEFAANCMLDGYGNWNTFNATINHDRIQSGEAFVRMVIVPSGTDGVRIPLRLQTIESEYCDITYTGEFNEPNTRYGITFDPNTNKPSKYHFYRSGRYGLQEQQKLDFQLQSKIAVDAADICHIFERRRSNQWRGVPQIAAILQDVYGLEDLTDATIMQQINASAISWIVERTVGGMMAPSSLGSVTTGMALSDTNAAISKLHFVATGGQVQYTQPGETFKLVQSRDIGENLITMLNFIIQSIATTYNLPYYMLSGNTSGLDFSSIRGVLIEFRDYLEYCYHFLIIPNGIQRIVDRFLALAELQSDEIAKSIAESNVVFRLPKNFGIDELKDNQALLLEMQTGGETIQRRLQEANISEEEFLKHIQFAKDNDLYHLISTRGIAGNGNNSEAKSNSVAA